MNRKVNVDRCRFKGFMPHQGLNSRKIGTVLIQMGPEGMPEGVTGQTFWPAEFFFVSSDMPGKEKGIDRARRVCLFREKPSCGPAAFESVLCEDVESSFRENRILVTTVLAMGDMNARDKGKVRVEPSHRDLRRAPGFMKDVKSKEMDLRDGGTDCPVRKGTFLLQDIQEFPVQSFRF